MPNKKFCKKCDTRHIPPTERNCINVTEDSEDDKETVNELYRDTAISRGAGSVAYGG